MPSGSANRVGGLRPATERHSLSAKQAAKPCFVVRQRDRNLDKLELTSPCGRDRRPRRQIRRKGRGNHHDGRSDQSPLAIDGLRDSSRISHPGIPQESSPGALLAVV